MSSDTTPMVCGICMRPLSRLNGVWTHLQEPNHVAQPIPRAEALEIDYRCDFCSSPDVKWVYFTEEYQRHDVSVQKRGEFGKPQPLTPKTSVRERKVVSKVDTYSSMGEKWASCDPCAKLVDRLEVGYLVRRVKQAEPRVSTAYLKRHFTDLFRLIKGKTEFAEPDAKPQED